MLIPSAKMWYHANQFEERAMCSAPLPLIIVTHLAALAIRMKHQIDIHIMLELFDDT